MRLVIVESPYAGEVELNVEYARGALADCLARGEAPYASHLLYTQPGVLDDLKPEERKLGIEAGLAFGDVCNLSAVYVDRGWSSGMAYGVERARKARRPLEIRTLPEFNTLNGSVRGVTLARVEFVTLTASQTLVTPGIGLTLFKPLPETPLVELLKQGLAVFGPAHPVLTLVTQPDGEFELRTGRVEVVEDSLYDH